MARMQPGSGGPYAEVDQLRRRVQSLNQELFCKPMGRTTRRQKLKELADLKEELHDANISVRALKVLAQASHQSWMKQASHKLGVRVEEMPSEITEHDRERAHDALEALRRAGFKVAVRTKAAR